MFPTFNLLGRTISSYGLLSIAGGLLAGVYACRMCKKRNLDDNDMIVTLLIAAVGSLIGGHLLYAITNLQSIWGVLADWRTAGFITTLQSLAPYFGGAVFYGGLLGAIFSAFLYLRTKQVKISVFSDILAPATPLFHTFGRIGCFFGGCCYGIECKFGITYHNNLIEQANGVSRFPVQLAEAGYNLVLFLLLHWLLQRNRLTGRLFGCYLALYAVGRFMLEFLRGDSYRGFLWRLSTSQWISIVLFIVATTMLVITSCRKHQSCSD